MRIVDQRLYAMKLEGLANPSFDAVATQFDGWSPARGCASRRTFPQLSARRPFTQSRPFVRPAIR